MIRTPYNTTLTPEGVTVQTFLPSMRYSAGYLKISGPLSMSELIGSCEYSKLTLQNREYGVEVDSSEFDRIAGKTFTPGGGAWSVNAQTLKGTTDRGEVTCRFDVTQALDGCIFVTAYADVPTPDGPTIQVQLNVEFD